MWTFKRTFQEAFSSGGILLFGLGCLFLCRQQYYPSALGPLSFGMITFGAIGFVRHLMKQLVSSIESSKYEEILLLEQRLSEIEANSGMRDELLETCSRLMEVSQRDSFFSKEFAAVLAEILRSQDVATSRGRTQETLSDVHLEPLAGGSPRESGNEELCEEDIGARKFDVQQEQIVRDPKTFREQILEIQSNNSDSFQCLATESHLKEKTKKQQLEITGEPSFDKLDVQQEQTRIDPETVKEQVLQIRSNISASLQCLTTENHQKEETKKQHLEITGEPSFEKFDVQQEQTRVDPDSVKEQVLQTQSNISASLQCLETENHQKEESMKQHLKKTVESKQEDLGNISEKVTEKDIMKREDGVLEDIGKVGDDFVECKREEIENLSNNEIQPEGKEELQSKESDDLNPQEERSEDISPKEIQMAKEKSAEKFLNELEQVISEI